MRPVEGQLTQIFVVMTFLVLLKQGVKFFRGVSLTLVGNTQHSHASLELFFLHNRNSVHSYPSCQFKLFIQEDGEEIYC